MSARAQLRRGSGRCYSGSTVYKSPASRSRRQLIVGVLGCVALQLSGVAHQVMVRHSRCVEHGEIIHSDGLAQGHGGSAAPRDARSRVERAQETGPQSHDHCAAVFEQRKALGMASACVISARELTVPPDWAPRATPDTGREIYDFAPKTSPPSRA